MPLTQDEANAEDNVRKAIFDALQGTDYMPPDVVLLTDLVVVFGCIDRDGDTGFGLFCAGAVHSLRGLADFAYDSMTDAMSDADDL